MLRIIAIYMHNTIGEFLYWFEFYSTVKFWIHANITDLKAIYFGTMMPGQLGHPMCSVTPQLIASDSEPEETSGYILLVPHSQLYMTGSWVGWSLWW